MEGKIAPDRSQRKDRRRRALRLLHETCTGRDRNTLSKGVRPLFWDAFLQEGRRCLLEDTQHTDFRGSRKRFHGTRKSTSGGNARSAFLFLPTSKRRSRPLSTRTRSSSCSWTRCTGAPAQQVLRCPHTGIPPDGPQGRSSFRPHPCH